MNKNRFIILALLIPVFIGIGQNQGKDIWEPLRYLEGTWEGKGDGMSGVSTVVQEYEFILNGNFMRMTTKSVFKPQEKNPEGEVHEDIGFFSFDRARRQFIMRGFYVEGFVNHYAGTVSEDGKTVTFETEAVENAPPGTRAKLVFVRTGERELEQSFHVAWPDRDYGCLSTNILKKK
jgi:hypothetical protein